MRERKLFILFLSVFAALTSIYNYEGMVDAMNTTTMAFSYKYGFIPRAFLGSLLKAVDILPGEQYTYEGVCILSWILQVVFLLVLILFINYIIKKAGEKMLFKLAPTIIVFVIFAFPEYVTEENFGRPDVVMVILTIIGVYALIKQKFEWIVVPIAIISMCNHQGYILMFLNVLLVLLFVGCFDNKKKRNYYIVLIVLLIITSISLFVYLNFYSHNNSVEEYKMIYSDAEKLSYYNLVHKEVMMHEILGESPFVDEWPYHIVNFEEFGIFALLMSPYIYLGGKFFVKCVMKAQGIEKLKYLALAFGSFTILPDMIVKIDYGRWMFAILTYYFLVVIAMIAKKDMICVNEYNAIAKSFSNKKSVALGMIVYPFLFSPFLANGITALTGIIVNYFRGV